MSTAEGLLPEATADRRPFWSYLETRELERYPSPALRWWLVALITIAWATEQFERLRLSPVLVCFLDDFRIGLTE